MSIENETLEHTCLKTFFKTSTTSRLSLGSTCANPSDSQINSSLTCEATRVSSPFWMFVCMPIKRAVSLAMFKWSPVIIFTLIPALIKFL